MRESSVFPPETELAWATLGAIPEMFQTVMGTLTMGLEVQAGQSLLIRGGTSSISMTSARLAKNLGLTILSTTRNPNKINTLKANAVDQVVMDDGDIVGQVRELIPDGVDRVLELIGTKTLLFSLQTAKRSGIVDISIKDWMILRL